MALIDYEIILDFIWAENFVMLAANVADQITILSIIDTKIYVLVVAFSTVDNAKLLEQLKSGFERIINWNKYQTKASTEKPSKYSDFLLDPRVNK